MLSRILVTLSECVCVCVCVDTVEEKSIYGLAGFVETIL